MNPFPTSLSKLALFQALEMLSILRCHHQSNFLTEQLSYRLRSEHAPTFRFLYQDPAPPSVSSFPNVAPRPWQRAYHSSDLPIIFGTHSIARGPSTQYEELLCREWQELYVAFAEDGPDGLRARGWQDSSEGKGVIFGSGDKGWEVVDIERIEE